MRRQLEKKRLGHALLAVVLAAVVAPCRAAVLLGRRLRREAALELAQVLELAEVEEDAAALVALLDVDAVAVVGAHGAPALGADEALGLVRGTRRVLVGEGRRLLGHGPHPHIREQASNRASAGCSL
jgi:hypothetical protein